MSSAVRRNKGESKTGLQLLGDLDNAVGDVVADTLFKNGGPLGAKIIQDALNEYLPSSEFKEPDRIIGSKTYQNLQNIAADRKKSKDFLDKLANQRMQQEDNAKSEQDRIYHYRSVFREPAK